MLSTNKDGSMLSMIDENGKARVIVSTHKDGAILSVRDENGEARVRLSMDTGGPALAIADEKGEDRAVLGASSTVSPSGNKMTYSESTLILFGPDGKVLWANPTK
jgi:hypothetical protein